MALHGHLVASASPGAVVVTTGELKLVISLTRSNSSDVWNTPLSVIMPVMRLAGVTSNAGFQQAIPEV